MATLDYFRYSGPVWMSSSHTNFHMDGDCSSPGRIEHAELRSGAVQNSYPVGTTLSYRCIPGYELIPGTIPRITCSPTSEWSPKAPRFCQGRRCPSPDLEHGRIVSSTDMRLGDQITFACDQGYRLIGDSTARCTLKAGTVDWDNRPFCQRIPCFPPPPTAHGTMSGDVRDEYDHGTAVTYKCDAGYSLIGKKSIVCRVAADGQNGEWDSPPPECKVVQCPRPEIEHGSISAFMPSYTYDHSLVITCDAGYTLSGANLIKCGADNNWHPPVPTCVFECNKTVAIVLERRYVVLLAGASQQILYSISDCIEDLSLSTVFAHGDKCSTGQQGLADELQAFCCLGLLIVVAVIVFALYYKAHRTQGKWMMLPKLAIHSGSVVKLFLAKFSTGSDLSWEKCAWGEESWGDNCGPPARLHFAELADKFKDMNSFAVNTTVNYVCRPGYAKDPGLKASVTCLGNQTWSEVPEFCKKKSCGHPKEPKNGQLIVPKDLLLGSTVSYTCDEGYRRIGVSSRRCVISNGRVIWTGDVPFCQLIPCYPPPEVPHGRRTGMHKDDFYYGDSVTYTCEKGYPLHGTASIHCTTKDGKNGVWSGQVYCGVSQCPSPPDIANGKHTGVAEKQFTSLMSVTYVCDPGYLLVGEASIFCTASGDWSHPVPHCEVVQCQAPPDILKGTRSNMEAKVFTNGTTVTYTCDPGSILIGEATVYCMASGTWSSPAPRCKVMRCHAPPHVDNATYSYHESSAFRDGIFVNYTCEPGYTLIGGATLYCTASGTWNLPAPRCEGSCGPPMRLSFAELANKYQENNSFPVGTTVNYVCRPGYAKHPGLRASVTCLTSQKWAEAQEFCRRRSCGYPGDPENGRSIITDDILLGSTVHYTCDEGHKRIGQTSRQCVVSGRRVMWTGISCSPPPDVPHGKHSGRYREDFSFATSVTYTCEEGYPMVGNASIHCTTKDGINGVWSDRVYCGVAECPHPVVESGRIVTGRSNTYTPKHKVTFDCNAGHVKVGSGEMYCQVDGTWEPPPPHCELAVLCSTPQTIANGKHNREKSELFTSGVLVEYSCEPGYNLIGESTIYCTESGSWNSTAPKCEGESVAAF
ncbi:complement receptor type 1-like [Tiliqua scincoides]|uniref:complement receptor type 1-like n=1 Tax=Tiliqua scincoides TaxID=71010 RepID=UPI00346328DB